MILHAKQAFIDLAYRQIVPVADAAGTRVDCVRGRLWITERGCADDIVLEAGESYVISRAGLAVVQALREARVGLLAPQQRPNKPAASAVGAGMMHTASGLA